ncbi:4742_t:CDS:2, partial [Racocetra fulgida]
DDNIDVNNDNNVDGNSKDYDTDDNKKKLAVKPKISHFQQFTNLKRIYDILQK